MSRSDMPGLDAFHPATVDTEHVCEPAAIGRLLRIYYNFVPRTLRFVDEEFDNGFLGVFTIHKAHDGNYLIALHGNRFGSRTQYRNSVGIGYTYLRFS